MKKKRHRRKEQKPPPARSRGAAASVGKGAPLGPLQYKVVELSTVDEASLENTLNEWVRRGWNLDGIQFAMRESSKRPAMAFVLFTRQGGAEAEHDAEAARARLRRLAQGPPDAQPDLA